MKRGRPRKSSVASAEPVHKEGATPQIGPEESETTKNPLPAVLTRVTSQSSVLLISAHNLKYLVSSALISQVP